jgi:hypothetical protein
MGADIVVTPDLLGGVLNINSLGSQVGHAVAEIFSCPG